MSNEKDTVDYTVRGFTKSFDTTLTHLSILRNKPKSVILRELLEEQLTDRIKTFGALSQLVAGMDEVLASHFGAKLSENPLENHFGTKYNLAMCDVLDIKTDEQLQQIQIRNTPYITARADQVMAGCKTVIKGQSLWFALFAELAFSDEEVVRRGWNEVFYSIDEDRYYSYYEHVNQLRCMRGMSSIQAEKNDFTHEGRLCRLNVTKPASYQYGAWRVSISLKDGVNVTEPDVLTGLHYPRLPHRLVIADRDEPYCSVASGEEDSEPGFRFVDGVCELDVYSNGKPERSNPTPMTKVAEALAAEIDARLKPFTG
ncbi:hypothetical protein [Serratia marcescens]|uniref:hypothetical protein n=1 Tax=Serratia marcescens TaxID=615 RepID=UPI00148D3448|nr:hypothetical protein [Serratia marcescens]